MCGVKEGKKRDQERGMKSQKKEGGEKMEEERWGGRNRKIRRMSTR